MFSSFTPKDVEIATFSPATGIPENLRLVEALKPVAERFMHRFHGDDTYSIRKTYVHGFVHWVAAQTTRVTHDMLSVHPVQRINSRGNGDLMSLLHEAEDAISATAVEAMLLCADRSRRRVTIIPDSFTRRSMFGDDADAICLNVGRPEVHLSMTWNASATDVNKAASHLLGLSQFEELITDRAVFGDVLVTNEDVDTAKAVDFDTHMFAQWCRRVYSLTPETRADLLRDCGKTRAEFVMEAQSMNEMKAHIHAVHESPDFFEALLGVISEKMHQKKFGVAPPRGDRWNDLTAVIIERTVDFT